MEKSRNPTNEYATKAQIIEKPTNECAGQGQNHQKPTNEYQAPRRSRGGQPGNRNAVTHGRRTAEARAGRAEDRAMMREVRDLCDVVNDLWRAHRARQKRERDQKIA